jgi:hypothetical protein
MKVLRIAAMAIVASLVFVPTAMAERVKPNISFFSGAQDDAHWTPLDSSDANRMSIELEVGPLATGGLGYAGLDFNHVEGRPAPLVEPYFWHKEDRESPASGGSPRLSIIFANGGVLDLRPDEWSQEWRKVGGDGEQGEQGNWDVRNHVCPFTYDAEYEQVRPCFDGIPVANVILVTDSNWMADKLTGYTNWVDQIQYDGFVFSHASDNNNSAATG